MPRRISQNPPPQAAPQYQDTPFASGFPMSFSLRQDYHWTGWHFARPHIHPTLELGYCHDGSGVFQAGERLFDFDTGDILIAPPNEPHRAYYHGRCLCSWFFIDPVGLLAARGVLPEIVDCSALGGPDADRAVHTTHVPHAQNLIEALVDECGSKRPFQHDAVTALVTSLLILLTRACRRSAPSPRPAAFLTRLHRRIAPAITLVHEHPEQASSVSDLARACAMAPTSFRRAFRRITGRQPAAYLAVSRIAVAKERLRDSTESIQMIALSLGFDDMSTFRRTFRRLAGMSPRQWQAGVR